MRKSLLGIVAVALLVAACEPVNIPRLPEDDEDDLGEPPTTEMIRDQHTGKRLLD